MSNFQRLIQSLILIIPATLLFYTIIVVFGAPLTTHIPQTLLTALHIALFCAYPLSSSITLNSENMRQLITLEYHADVDVLKCAYWGGIGTIIGAWLGAVPIPLDWDREWQVNNCDASGLTEQKWPITIIVGAYIGHAIGLLLAIMWRGISTKALKPSPNRERIEEDLNVP